jgi:Zn-dependent peptidase ImmA (M78 family)
MFARGFKSWCENVALQQRRNLRLSKTDPLDPLVLAKRLDVIVWTPNDVAGVDASVVHVLTKDDPSSWSAISLQGNGRQLVILNPAHSAGRTASSLMHELSHLLLEHQAARVDVSQDGMLLNTYVKAQEEEADWLAGCMLLPRDALFAIRKQGLTDEQAAAAYGTSEVMLRYRIRVTGIDRQLERASRRHRN